jgi:catechol 2,3-dioxygenase-like lactoylglutathione lyase family enzyme
MFENTKAFSGFSVNDLEAAKKFYGEVLGLTTSEHYGLLTLHLAAAGTRWSTPSPITRPRPTRSSTSPSMISTRPSTN